MKKLLLTTIVFCVSFTFLHASHLLGADINYECIGNGSYQVTLQLYRDCNGITPSNSQTLFYSSAICGVNGSIQLSLLGSPVDITPLCPSEQSACSGNGSIGIQNWTYQGILNLPAGCGNDWVLGWSQCCRNGAINTLNSPSNQDMYVGVNLDNTITPICNSSPVFNNAPGSIVCVNQPVVYNHGVSDADGDSLFFSLGTCYQGQGQSVNYGGGFSPPIPLTTVSGVSINSSTGALTFTPSAQQVGVLCVNVKEYRNGVLIGEVNRDMQFTVIACSNVPPQASGVDGAPNNNPVNFETSICANGNLCFTIDGFDANPNNVTMSWNGEIAGGTFVVSNNGTPTPSAEFCWNPGMADIGQNIFTVNVEDDACPIIGQGTYTYIIDVLPSPNTLDAGENDTICFGESTVLNATSTPLATSYTWTPVASLSSSTGASVTASPLVNTAYEVSADFPDGCNLTDIVSVYIAENPVVSVSPSNVFNCSGQANVLTAISNNASSFVWNPGALAGATATFSPTSTTTYTVTAANGFGCTSDASVTVTIAAPAGNVCNLLYVTPTGSPTGIGSKTDPMDLITALEVGACNGTTVKMAIGDYVTDTVINRITSYITLEGGFDPSINWDKLSTTGATRILRTATQSYSLVSNSIVLGSGIVNESGPDPEVVAIQVANQTGFRFQDITVETELNSPGTTMAGFEGPDVFGIRLNSCDGYNVVRTQIIANNGADGADRNWSITQTSGGDSKAVEILTNGAGGNIINSLLTAGTGGAGGAGGGTGPTATGAPFGANGSSNNITITGTALSTNDNNFNLSSQAVIRMDDISCTETLMDFTQAVSNSWTFGPSSTPATATGSLVTTQYSTVGRKDISYGANTYSGFANILLDSQVLPTFTTSAPIVQGQYRICAGEEVNFAATNGGVGYVYHWDMGGGAIPNNYDGPSFSSLASVAFDDAGIYTIELQLETNCCGLSIPTTIDLYVEEQPIASITPMVADLCLGSSTPIMLTAEDSINFGVISWSPSTGLDNSNTFVVNALPGDTTTYSISITDSTGLCADIASTTVNVINLQLSTSVVSTFCGSDGSATVSAIGGSGSYSYAWDDPANQTTSTANNLAVGTYSVLVTDQNSGCQDSALVTVNPGQGALTGFVSTTSPVSCVGEADGYAVVSVIGGQAPYDYVWSPAGGSELGTFSLMDTSDLLPGGNYSVLITDDAGCDYLVDVFIPEPDTIILEEDSIANPTCVGATDGFIMVFADGGNAPLMITWDDPNNQVGITATNLGVGTYCATVVDDSGCSDTICFTLTAPLLTSQIDTTVCFATNYTFPNGSSGVVNTDTTQVDSLTTLIGCDSIVTTNITVVPEKTGSIDTVLCYNESITVNGNVYDTTVVGAIEIFPNNGPSSCDSIVSINITVQELVIENIDTIICQGDILTVNGQIYSQSGSYNDTASYVGSGCDSVQYVINLAIDSFSIENIDTTICQGQSITVNGQTYTQSGTYNDTATYALSGCDSIQYVINLSIDSFSIENIDITLCQGQSLTVNGQTYTQTGSYNDTATYAMSGCDSIQYVINLSIDSFSIENIDTTICQGQSLTVNGQTYAQSGLYNDTASYIGSGCDSIQYVINLSIDSFVIENIDTTICQGQSLTVNGQTYTQSGLYNDTASYAGSGCDSVQYIINLAIDSFVIENIDTTLCFGESLTVNGVNYNATGIYQDTLRYVASGCDQIQFNIDLEILDEKLGLVDTAVCEGESIFVNGTEYSTTTIGAQEVFVVGPQQCDSTVTVNLLVNELPNIAAAATPDTIFIGGTSVLNAQGSGNFEWDGMVNDSVYQVDPDVTTSYTVVLTDSNGCISDFTVTVFVLSATEDQIVIPDAFTPNGDGRNEVFRVVSDIYFEDIEMIVYNRWGEMLHRENGSQNHGWDGTFKGEKQPSETYVYLIRLKTFDGQEFNLSGNVTLIR